MRVHLVSLGTFCVAWIGMGCDEELAGPARMGGEISGVRFIETPSLAVNEWGECGGMAWWPAQSFCEEEDDYSYCSWSAGYESSRFVVHIGCYCTNGSFLDSSGQCACPAGTGGPDCMPDEEPWHDDGSDPDGDGPPISGGGPP